MQSFLLFQLYGPLSSWGEVAVGGERPTATHPGRSAILGMLAAAAGIRRDEEDKHLALEHGLGMAVRMESAGTYLKDYHTSQTPPQTALKKHPHETRRDELMALSAYQKSNPKASGTILSNRSYRCDGLYQIGLWQRQDSEFSLQYFMDCLNQPGFVLYLGRKSCPPALPLQPQIVEANTLVEAFKQARFVSLQMFLQDTGGKRKYFQENFRKNYLEKHPVSLFWDSDGASGIQAKETFIRRDALRSRDRWQFKERQELHALQLRQEE